MIKERNGQRENCYKLLAKIYRTQIDMNMADDRVKSAYKTIQEGGSICSECSHEECGGRK